MLEDLLAVIWKERKGLLRMQGSVGRTLLSLVVPILMIGIVLPLQMGREWLETAWSLLAVFLIPVIVVGMAVPQSFAGERERHTLETLLASRLPDRAILFGKLLLAVAYGWGMTLAVLLLSMVLANLFHWSGQFLFYRPLMALAGVVLSLLTSGLTATLGVLISLRAATAQGAQQTLIMILLVPLIVLQVVPFVLMSVVPDGMDRLQGWLSVPLWQAVLVLVLVLVGLNLVTLLLAMARFQRARLALD